MLPQTRPRPGKGGPSDKQQQGAGRDMKTPVLGSVKAPRHGLANFAQEIQKLQRRSQQSAAQAQHGGSMVEYLVVQVGVLQEAFVTMADSVIQELDVMRQESRRWQSDRQEWLSSILALRQEANDKLLQVDRAQAMAAVELSTAKAEMQAVVSQQARQLDLQAEVLGQQVSTARVDVQMLRNVVREMQTLTSRDFPNEVLRQRMLDKEVMDDAITQAVRDVVPRLVSEAVQQEAPAAVREQVGPTLRELLEQRTEPIRHEVRRAVDQMSSDVGALSTDVTTLAGAVEALSSRAKALESGCSTTDHRVSSLEALELPLLGGLQDRLDAVSSQQARFAQSMEGVVRAVVDDASDLARTAQRQATQLQAHSHHLDDTREALVRCASVFSALLGVPAPIPLTAMMAATAGGGGGGGAGAGGLDGLLSPLSVDSPPA